MKEENQISDKLIKEIYEQCDVYPLPERQKVTEEVIKMKKIMKSRNKMEPSDRRVARKISRALDMRTRINNDEWIEYEGSKIEKNR